MNVMNIVSDEEIDAHHFGRFGDADPREIVNEGVVKAMLGYSSGSTVTTILLRHQLIRARRSLREEPRLTKKGFKYARALFANTRVRDLLKKLTAQ